MRAPRLLPVLALSLSPCVALAAGETSSTDVASFHFAGPARGAVALAAVNGSVHAAASTDGTLDVRAIVRKGDASSLRVVTRNEDAGLAICILYAEDSPSDCTLSGASHHHHNGHGSEPEVDLVARVPADVALAVRSTNGSVEALGIAGSVRAATTNGSVKVEAAAIPSAETTNGDVDARFTAPPTGDVSLETTNGSIRAVFPAALDATVDAATVQGDLHASFPMDVSATPGGWGPKSGHATVGKGTARVHAATTNGSVDLKTR